MDVTTDGPASAVARLRDLMHLSSLFDGLNDEQLDRLSAAVCHERAVAPGADLITEGDPAGEFFIIESGSFEVLKKDESGREDHRIATIHPGSTVGEMGLLDRAPRSATVRALDHAVVLVFPLERLDAMSRDGLAGVGGCIKMNLAGELARRLRTMNQSNVKTQQERLEEAELRAEMGRFMSRVLIGTCLYMFALSFMGPLRQLVPDSTVISGIILLCFAIALYINIRTSRFPSSAYGFTLYNWKPALWEATLFSLPILALIVLVKWVMIQTVPSFANEPILDFYRYRSDSVFHTLAAVAGYSAFVPFQEMVARSGMQSSFMMFLTSRHRLPLAIFMSTLLFSATHLHISAAFALLVFPLGVFWGWLYARHPTLVGVIFSHILIGVWGVFVVSFPLF